ncbi:MAG TPA: alpha/beta hydrolase [Stellaceae bacterium]|jgi:pimeloyl-ACP methyl ester carboxylesterase|nr:alpha/beta hydrolase [Stellaceae bacterium]
MDTHLATMTADKYVTIDGLKIRYLEEGTGTPVVFMHGASLGSSADVFRRNLPNFAKAGFRAIAFDFPGYGLSEVGDDLGLAYQTNTAPKLIDALGLGKVALVAHSRSGGQAVQLAGKEPARYSHLVVLGTGGLIPPLPADIEGRYNQVAARVDRQMAESEPTPADTEKLMKADLFHTELVTPAELALRHSRSIGRNFEIFTKRARSEEGAGGSGQTPAVPQWQRMLDLKIPTLLIYGRQDRAHAGERAELFKKSHPHVNLHIMEGCKHMVPWDAEQEVYRLAIPFIKGQ